MNAHLMRVVVLLSVFTDYAAREKEISDADQMASHCSVIHASDEVTWLP